MKLDLKEFEGRLPYSSEIYGVYSSMLGWKSNRAKERFSTNVSHIASMRPLLKQYAIQGTSEVDTQQWQLNLVDSSPILKKVLIGSYVLSGFSDAVRQYYPGETNIVEKGIVLLKDTQSDFIQILEDKIRTGIREMFTDEINGDKNLKKMVSQNQVDLTGKYNKKYTEELRTLELLKDLAKYDKKEEIKYLLDKEDAYQKKQTEDFLSVLQRMPLTKKPIFDVVENMKDTVLSPLGIVHLFRQYFFEFDTFLGTPVDHVWLSPGSSVTLVETKTSKRLIEKSINQSFESTQETEESTKVTDEFSELVKKENNQDISLGASVDVNQSWTGGSMNASTNLDFNQVRNESKENAHKRMREQSSRVSSKLKSTYQTSFRSVEEYEDVKSKKYVMANTTDRLINYELRRKMRRVGVQVQDIGSYLCWQTFVDNPGKKIGLANLIHIASPADLDSIPKEGLLQEPKVKTVEQTVTLQFKQIFQGRYSSHDKLLTDKVYVDGKEVDKDNDFHPGDARIDPQYEISVPPPEPDYQLTHIALVSTNNTACDLKIDTTNLDKTGRKINLYLKMVDFGGKTQMEVTFRCVWSPTEDSFKRVNDNNLKVESTYEKRVEQATKEAYFESVKERTNYASDIKERDFRGLREEERIMVYRDLIDSLLISAFGKNYSFNEKNQQQHHVFSEVVNSIFDINKMLYYVAPDWWRPKKQSSNQSFMRSIKGANIKDIQLDWGGDRRASNYLITEESQPAKLGSSLGWLMQLDGDNMRNAFLNAPWVKAVIPIRPGKELIALKWLEEVEGKDGLDSDYMSGGDVPPEYAGMSIRKVLQELAEKLAKKHNKAKKVEKYPPINDDNTVSATPIDKVYEYGFYPLEGGFKAQTTEDYEIFDQWVEVLPTDQIVPVEVEYDPKTGIQI